MDLGTVLWWAGVAVGVWIGAVLCGGLWKRVVAPYIPVRLRRAWHTAMYYYQWPVRRLTPDWIYKLWYRTGTITADQYRAAQNAGWITDDLDPEHLQPCDADDQPAEEY